MTRLRAILRRLVCYMPGYANLTSQVTEFSKVNGQLQTELHRLMRMLHQLVFSGDEPLVEQGPLPDSAGSLPVPAGVLRYLVAGTEDLKWFLSAGQHGADTVRDALGRRGKSCRDLGRILDFGCGCGRVLRHFAGENGPEFHGADCNRTAIAWCQAHLPFAQCRTNDLAPPLSYGDGAFDLIYSFSIFTHLDADLQARWMRELHRVLAPGGLLLISLHGDAFAYLLNAAQKAQYSQGNMVTALAEVEGSNYCMAYHPESYVRGVLATDYRVLEFVPQGARGNPTQDLYVLQKSAHPAVQEAQISPSRRAA